MKLEHIIEAKYYRKHSVDDVYARLVDMSNVTFKGISVSNPQIPLSYENALTVRVFLHNADTEQEAINQVRSLMKKYGIPFTDIGYVVDYGNRSWRVTVSYDPTHLNEARYYRRHTLKQIEQRLGELSRETKKDDIYVSDQSIINGKVHADLYVYGIEDEDDVVKTVEQFFIKQGIPFTRIWNVINTTYRNTGFQYTATMTYDPKQIADRELTEARYQPHGEVSRRYAVFDPKTGLFPYTVLGMGLPRPKTSDTYHTADEARDRIKEMHDQAIRYQGMNPQRHTHENVAHTKKIQAAVEATRYYRVVEMIVRYAK